MPQLPWLGYHGNQPFVCGCGLVFDTSVGYSKHKVDVCGGGEVTGWGATSGDQYPD